MKFLSKRYKKINLEEYLFALLTLVLFVSIPITVFFTREKTQDFPSQETFAATCVNSEAKVSWPSTTGCLVEKNISWNSVSYKIQVFLPKSVDPDRDGYSSKDEKKIGTDPKRSCSTSGIDAWPPDFNKDGAVAFTDFLLLLQKFGTVEGKEGFSQRFDLDMNGAITIGDFLALLQKFGDVCGCGGSCTFRDATVANTSYSITSVARDQVFNWKVCYPDCSAGNYQEEGSAKSNSSGKLTFEWSGIPYNITVFDLDAGILSIHPGTPEKVKGTSLTVTGLYSKRNYRYKVCYQDCSAGVLIAQNTFTSPTCTGPNATYSVRLTRNGTSEIVKPEVTNLTGTSHTFRELDSNTDYDFYVYSPSGQNNRVYKKGDITSNAGICTLTRDELEDSMFFWINLNRELRGIPGLKRSSELDQAARIRSDETTQKFSHTRPDGRASITVLIDLNISYAWYGEVIARNNYQDDYESARRAVEAWVESPGHKEAIFNTNMTHIGIGATKASGGLKYYTGVLISIP